MRLSYVDLCGFRGYRKRLRIEFGREFTIIDGRNGVGKSTVFDAVEFALTGALSKYKDAKADGETVADYIWWTGDGDAPVDRFVEVGFENGEHEISVRRTQFDKPDPEILADLADRLCDMRLAPEAPLIQLCATSIIRDEHIAGLSLDLKETERYALLRDGLGANDADVWIARAARLVNSAKQRSSASQQDVAKCNSELAAASRRIDELRSSLVSDAVLAEVIERLRAFAGSEIAADQLGGPARERVAQLENEFTLLEEVRREGVAAERARSELPALRQSVVDAAAQVEAIVESLAAISVSGFQQSASVYEKQARDVMNLVSLGRDIGLREGHCPLCTAERTPEQFADSLAAAEQLARSLNAQAAENAKKEDAKRQADSRLALAHTALSRAEGQFGVANGIVEKYASLRGRVGLDDDVDIEKVTFLMAQIRQRVGAAQQDLRILDTIRLNQELERAVRDEATLRDRLTASQERAGRVRRAETVAQSLYDAARRAAGETLDRRLERVLPLMSELYRRLRPHPIWRDIEYSIRGDVRRFLKLQVGDELNPQFLFSSGQRRATGLAFLLSVNLSLAWSRLRAIMLDDPVQHVDDFRTVHLAELSAQLVTEGRQIICAVEDPALAELLSRRLPVSAVGSAKRITLGPDIDGDPHVSEERDLVPMRRYTLVSSESQAAAG